MGIELLQQGDNFLLFRSTGTGAIYAVKLQENKPKEPIVAAPVGGFLDGTPPAPREQSTEAAPAKRRARRGRVGGVAKGHVTPAGQAMRDIIVKTLSQADHPLATADLNAAAGDPLDGTRLYPHLNKMTAEGILTMTEEKYNREGGGRGRRRMYTLAQPNDPSGPESQRVSSPSQASSN